MKRFIAVYAPVMFACMFCRASVVTSDMTEEWRVHYLHQPAYTLPATHVTIPAKYLDEDALYSIVARPGWRVRVKITYTQQIAGSSGGLLVGDVGTGWEGQYAVGNSYERTFESTVTLRVSAYASGTYSGSNIREMYCAYRIAVTYEELIPDLRVSDIMLSPSPAI